MYFVFICCLFAKNTLSLALALGPLWLSECVCVQSVITALTETLCGARSDLSRFKIFFQQSQHDIQSSHHLINESQASEMKERCEAIQATMTLRACGLREGSLEMQQCRCGQLLTQLTEKIKHQSVLLNSLPRVLSRYDNICLQ